MLFFGSLLKRERDPPQILEVGKDGFRTDLDAVLRRAQDSGVELASIGIVRDAGENPRGALQSVQDAVRAVGLTPPATHGAFSDAAPRVGVFVMADGENPGALETLCRRSVETSAEGRWTDYLKCLDGLRADRNAAQRDKSFTHAWLASIKNPVARVGEGAAQGAWDFAHRAFARIADFVGRLAADD